jgi:hypothetical protein
LPTAAGAAATAAALPRCPTRADGANINAIHDGLPGVKRKIKMAKKSDIGADNWLYILTNAISNFVDEGGQILGLGDGEVTITLRGVGRDDPRLHPDFVKLLDLDEEQADEMV